MKEYPSIPGPSKAPKDYGIAFYKYDGSNLRFEWTKKNGWAKKYGTRTRLFDESDPTFAPAIKIFNETLASDLEAIFKKHYYKYDKITVFCEYFGDLSFAGQHKTEDNTKKLILIDVELFKYGFVPPREFVNIFCKTLNNKVAKVIYDGKLTEEFIQNVRENKYDLDEGVVFKGGEKHNLWRIKIKTNKYLDKLKETYQNNWKDFWE